MSDPVPASRSPLSRSQTRSNPCLAVVSLQARGQDGCDNVLLHPFVAAEVLLVLPVLGPEEGGLLAGKR